MIKLTQPDGGHVHVRSDSIVRVRKSSDNNDSICDLISGQTQSVTETVEHIIALMEEAEYQ